MNVSKLNEVEEKYILQNTAYPGRGDDKTEHTLDVQMEKHSIPWMCR